MDSSAVGVSHDSSVMALPSEPPLPSSSSVSSRLSKVRMPRFPRQQKSKFGDYTLGKTIGEGEFGKVKMAWDADNKPYAMKLIRQDKLAGVDAAQKNKIAHEINSLNACVHPHVIRLHRLMRTDQYIAILLEYASGGDMFNYIYKNGRPDERVAKKLFAQVVSGVSYLHQKGIVHRDLKLENLLLDSGNNILISDFGFANSFRTDSGFRLMQTSCGSPCYAAPEVVNSDMPYDGKKADVWSVGVILFTFLAGYLPFDDDPNNPESENIQQLYRYIATTPLKFPDWIGIEARDLLRRILVVNPEQRAKMGEIAAHSWLSEHVGLLSITAAEHEGVAAWQRGLTSKTQVPSRRSSAHPTANTSTTSEAIPDQRTTHASRHGRSSSMSTSMAPPESGVPIEKSQLGAGAARHRPVSAIPAPTSYRGHQPTVVTPAPRKTSNTSVQVVRTDSNASVKSLSGSSPSAAAAAAAAVSMSRTHNNSPVRPPVRSSSMTPGSVPLEKRKRQSMFAGSTIRSGNTGYDTNHSVSGRPARYSAADEVPALGIAPSPPQKHLAQPQRLTQTAKPRPISFQPPTPMYLEFGNGPSLYTPRQSQPRVELTRELSKNGEMSKPLEQRLSSVESDYSQDQTMSDSIIGNVPTRSSDQDRAGDYGAANSTLKQEPKPSPISIPYSASTTAIPSHGNRHSSSQIPRSVSVHAQRGPTIKAVGAQNSGEPTVQRHILPSEMRGTAPVLPMQSHPATTKNEVERPIERAPQRELSEQTLDTLNLSSHEVSSEAKNRQIEPTARNASNGDHSIGDVSMGDVSMGDISMGNRSASDQSMADRSDKSDDKSARSSRFRWSQAFWSRRSSSRPLPNVAPVPTKSTSRRASYAPTSGYQSPTYRTPISDRTAKAFSYVPSTSTSTSASNLTTNAPSAAVHGDSHGPVPQPKPQSNNRVPSGIPKKIVTETSTQDRNAVSFKNRTMNFFKRRSMVG